MYCYLKTGNNDDTWINPLNLYNNTQSLSLQFGDGYLTFGGIPNTNPITVVPLTIILSKHYNHGIAFIPDLNHIILGASLDINTTNLLYQRYFNKISQNFLKLISLENFLKFSTNQ